MKKLTATEIKSYAKQNNLKISGSIKNGYVVKIARSFEYEDISFDLKISGKDNWIKTMSYLAGAKTINQSTGDEFFKHWAHIYLIEAEAVAAEADTKPGYWSEYMGFDADYESDDWIQNAWDTAYEKYKLPVNTNFTDRADYVFDVGSEEAEEAWYNRPF